MIGRVRTLDVCPVCKKPFHSVKHPITKDHMDLICSDHKTRPLKYFIDARAFGAGKIYRNERGKLFDSFLMAARQLEEMRKQYDENKFDPSDYVPKKLQEFKLKTTAQKWLDLIKIDKSFSYWRHSKTEMDLHIIPVIGEMDVRDIRTTHVDDLYYKLHEKGLSPKSIKNILTTFQTFMKSLDEVIQRFPKFRVVKVPKKAKGWINREKQLQVLSHIHERHMLIFQTLVETAERPGEVCAHKRKDLIDGEICIERSFDEKGNLKEEKTGKVIYRGISLELWNRLQEHAKEKLPEAWLFLDEFGKPYSQSRLYDIWVRACKKVGVNISLYRGTRHSRASQKRLEKEKEIAEACRKELGHASQSTTMKHYAGSRKEELR